MLLSALKKYLTILVCKTHLTLIAKQFNSCWIACAWPHSKATAKACSESNTFSGRNSTQPSSGPDRTLCRTYWVRNLKRNGYLSQPGGTLRDSEEYPKAAVSPNFIWSMTVQLFEHRKISPVIHTSSSSAILQTYQWFQKPPEYLSTRRPLPIGK